LRPFDAASSSNRTRIEYRVGVNLGDVIVESDDIYGDGVNIATRIEGIAEPGQVFISGAIYEQIKHKVVCSYEVAWGPQGQVHHRSGARLSPAARRRRRRQDSRSAREHPDIFSEPRFVGIAGYVLCYLLAQPSSRVGQHAAAPPIVPPMASPTPQSVHVEPGSTAPAPQVAASGLAVAHSNAVARRFACDDYQNSGHHHLLIDVNDPIDPKEPIPQDKSHLHFGPGQTETAPSRHRHALAGAGRCEALSTRPLSRTRSVRIR
jgi:hypothetical protein